MKTLSSRELVGDDKKSTSPKGSISMTRNLGQDIGFIVKLDVLMAIENRTIDFTYSQWQWFVGYFWEDTAWKNALSQCITDFKNLKFNMNKCSYFVDFIFERTVNEMVESNEGAHPIYKQAFMELLTRNRPEKQPEREYCDLWLNPKELREKYRGN